MQFNFISWAIKMVYKLFPTKPDCIHISHLVTRLVTQARELYELQK